MALFIQLDSYAQQRQSRQRKNITSNKLEGILIDLKKSLALGGTQTAILREQQAKNGVKLVFITEVDSNSELFFRIWLTKSLHIWCSIVLVHKGSYTKIRSTEIRKNICKIISLINTSNKKSQIFLMIDSRTGQLVFWPSHYLARGQSKQTIQSNLKSLITQCLSFAKHFNNLLLYKANLISKQNFYHNLTDKNKSMLFNNNGYFNNINKIQQFISFSNCKISYSLRQTKNLKFEKGYQHVSIQRIRQIFYNRSFTHDIVLYTDKSFYGKVKKSKLQATDYNSLILDYKPKQRIKYDNNYVFSTIYLHQEQTKFKHKEICIAQSQKVKALLINAKITYGLTLPSNDVKQLMDELSIQYKQTQNQFNPSPSKMIEKNLVAKVPNPKLPHEFQEKVFQAISYQKMILRNLRGAECRFLPKYYQTQQKNLKYRDSLLIDYIPGPTLGSIFANNIKQKSIVWKINLLMNLSNAIRFLQVYDIAHLDISVNNIVITDNYIPKLIDFGQAFHQQTTQSFLRLKKIKKKCYRPGRTFPFAAPQTTSNEWKFNSKQDIFSFGIIAFYLILGYFPNNCSEKNISKLYINGNFNQSILFSPQGIEQIAENELMISCIQLILKCVQNNQKMRPQPSWTHIILVLMLELVDPND